MRTLRQNQIKREVRSAFKSVIEPTLQEEGCLKYELYISENDSSRYFFLEEWRSREDLDIHIASDYIQSLFGNIQSLIESSDIIEIKKYSLLALFINLLGLSNGIIQANTLP